MSLGGYPDVSPDDMRGALEKHRKVSIGGADPIEGRKAEKNRNGASRTFKAAAGHLIKSQAAGWSNKKRVAQWIATLTTHSYPIIGDMHVSAVTTEHVLRILQPIWTTKTETAS